MTESVLRRLGEQLRPFIMSAGVTQHCCSRPLQRAITDFGGDPAFGQVPKKLQEHYGINISASTARNITEFHGQQMHEQKEKASLPLTLPGCLQQVGEIDGCMLPIVTIGEEEGDKRKQKTLHWQETRLVLVHEQGSVTPKFDVTFGGSIDDAGQALMNCAVAAGFGTQTHLHGVGDGATWIANQFEAQFGTQASYLIDFYHVCEYLSAASKIGAPDTPVAWMDSQKNLLKNNESVVVIKNFSVHDKNRISR